MNPVLLYASAMLIGFPSGVLLRAWWLRHPRPESLQEILDRARAELTRNPTITVYTMVDGREVRRPAEPWARFRHSMRALGQAFIRVEVSAQGFRDSLQRALGAMPETRLWPPGWGVPVAPPRGVSVALSLSEPSTRTEEFLAEFEGALTAFESRMDCPHDSSSGGYGPDRTWRCDECGEITGREP